ncbi:MAG TPA: methyltransferase domain-containing protein [Tepidisphaeraceae bacterium]|nr:methyltransferase domain-containing protein [Tepidisphaeraceae bacterium]
MLNAPELMAVTEFEPVSMEPVSRSFGFDRGTPIDRHYIERFLAANADHIRGRVLEIGDATYTRRFGAGRVERSDVLHATPANRSATLVGDLASGAGIPHAAFDCIILTQVLPFIFDVRSAVATCRRALKPCGVVLATVPGISQISRYDMDRWGDFWRFTSLSARRLFEEQFGSEQVQVEAFGNLRVAVDFLRGLALEELPPGSLEHNDPDYELITAVKATRR